MRPSLSGAVSRTGVRDKGDLPLRPEIAAQTNEFKQLRNFSVNILLPDFLAARLPCRHLAVRLSHLAQVRLLRTEGAPVGLTMEEISLVSLSFGSDTEDLAEAYIIIDSEVERNGSLALGSLLQQGAIEEVMLKLEE
jgi:hypothetical protein